MLPYVYIFAPDLQSFCTLHTPFNISKTTMLRQMIILLENYILQDSVMRFWNIFMLSTVWLTIF